MPDHDQDLRDERALRLELEARLAAEIERTAAWRRRAEERSDRIARLQQDLSRARRPARRLINALRPVPTQGGQPGGAPVSPHIGDRGRPRAASPVVRVVAALGPHHAPISEEATAVAPTPAGVAGSDLVLVDRSGWERLNADDQQILIEGSQATSPTPTVYLAVSSTDRPPEDLSGVIRMEVEPTFPVVWGRPDRHLEPIVVEAQRLQIPDVELVVAGSRGRPIAVGGGPLDRDRASVAARRWSARLHAPWIRLAEILAAVGVRSRSPLPTLAGILVSNRPDRVAVALAALARQTRIPDEVIVGLHGITSQEVAAVAGRMPTAIEVMSFPESMTLGEALNRAVSASSASLVAKIDDDDHYGPAFFEDSTHDLVMSTAGLVGKAAMFMYRGDNDTMILRRGDQDDTVIAGTMPGGSLVMHRRVWDQVGFPHRPRFVDALLLDGARRMGEVAVSGHRYEFCLVRHGQNHTFAASSDRFTAGSVEVASGFDPALVEVPDLWTP